MSERNIKLQRTESLLKELIPEAFASLDDERINSVSVSDVICSKGKYDAQVFVAMPFEDKAEQKEILRSLNKASGRVATYILSVTDWFKCPKMTFKIDDKAEKLGKLEEIFKKISDGNK